MENVAQFAQLFDHYGALIVLSATAMAILLALVGMFVWYVKRMINHNFEHDRFMTDIRDESKSHTIELGELHELLSRLTVAYEQQSALLLKHEKTFESMEQLLKLLSDKVLLGRGSPKANPYRRTQ